MGETTNLNCLAGFLNHQHYVCIRPGSLPSPPTRTLSPASLHRRAAWIVTERWKPLNSIMIFFMYILNKIADVSPTFSETKLQMVPMDLNIGFQGLALIQGQIYNPVKGLRGISWILRLWNMRIDAFSFCFAVSVQGIFIQMVSKDHDYDNLIKKTQGPWTAALILRA